MTDESLFDFLKNNPIFFALFAVGLVCVFGAIKSIVGSRFQKVSERSVEAPSKSGKKKKSKKQKVISQDRKNSESTKTRRDIKSNEASSLPEKKKEIYEEKSDKRKDGSKSKGKSKKKKNLNQVRNETISEPTSKEANFDDDGWKTVSTKEQREQLRREKKKLEEEHTLSVESAVTENAPLVNISYKPIHDPAIAKGIAPRFARAAGAEWQEKPTSQPLLQPKRPMPRATIPGTGKTQVNPTTVTQQTWNQGNQPWQEALGWSVSNAPTLTPNLLSYHTPDAAKLLALARPGDKNAADVWTEGGVSWQSSDFLALDSLPQRDYANSFSSPRNVDRSPGHSSSSSDEVFGPRAAPIARTPYKSHSMRIQSDPISFRHAYEQAEIQFGSRTSNSSWDINAEDWVHVHGQNNGSNNKTESWPANEPSKQAKDDVWMLEPEGFTLPQVENPDPWGIEAAEPENGDWSAPKSSWDNANSEWTAPPSVETPLVYVDYSSDENVSKPEQVAGQMETQPFVVGVTQETSSKKSKRRRKKKPAPQTEQVQPQTPAVVLPEPSKADPATDICENPKAKSEEPTEDWSVPKVSKKRKPKARKAD